MRTYNKYILLLNKPSKITSCLRNDTLNIFIILPQNVSQRLDYGYNEECHFMNNM